MEVTSFGQTPNVAAPSEAGSAAVDKSNCHAEDVDPLIGLSGVHKCKLSLMVDERPTIVTHDTVHCDQTVLHSKPILPDHVFVSVDSCISEYAKMNISVPTEEFVTISDAVTSFVQWLRTMVILKDKRTSSPQIHSQTESVIRLENPTPESPIPKNPNSKNPNPKNPTPESPIPRNSNPKDPIPQYPTSEFRWNLSKKCTKLELLLVTYDSDMIYIPDRNRDIIHPNNPSQAVCISPQAIREMLSFQCLDTVVLEVFMLTLEKKHFQNFEKIAMLNPSLISATHWTKQNKDSSSVTLRQLLEPHLSKNLILCPYNEKSHWILLVVCVKKCKIYIFDPLGNGSRKFVLKAHLHRVLNASIHTQPEWTSRVDFSYIPAICVRQTGSVECEYYVMRYMYDIIMHHSQSENLLTDYARSEVYTISEIKAVLDLFAKHVGAVLMSSDSD